MNLKVFNMFKGINESTTLAKHILDCICKQSYFTSNQNKEFININICECRCEFVARKCNSRQKWKNDNCQCECKKPKSHRVCQEDYAWNPSTCTYYKCDKDWEIGKYLKECECMKSLVDNLAVTRDKIVHTPESVLINPSDGIDYWLITALLTIAGLLLLVVIVVKQHMKPGLTIPSLLYQYSHQGSCQAIAFPGRKKITSSNSESHKHMHLLENWMGQNPEKVLQQFLEKQRCEAEMTVKLMFLECSCGQQQLI